MSAAASASRADAAVIDWPAEQSDADLAQRIRRGLDEHGFVVLRGFTDAQTQAAYREDLLSDLARAGKNEGAKKYNLKGPTIADHRVVRRAREDDLLGLINAMAQCEPPLRQGAFGQEHVRTGYSIVKDHGDSVSFHFDDLNFINLIVPIVLPPEDRYDADLWAWPNLLPPPGGPRRRWIGRIAGLAANSSVRPLLPLRRYRYREGDALMFYGSRTLHGVLGAPDAGLRVIASLNYCWDPVASA